MSVHPSGNPATHSANSGGSGCGRTFSHSQSVRVNPSEGERVDAVPFLAPLLSPTVSVGNNEHARTSLRQTEGGSGEHTPFRIEPHAGQGPENSSNSTNKDGCDVLHDDVSGSKQANDAGVLRPQSAPTAFDAGLLPAAADVLAGESSADDIDSPAFGVAGWEGSDIVVPPDAGPVLLEYLAGERVDFHLPGCLQSRTLEAEVESADSGEEAAHREAHRKSLHIRLGCGPLCPW